MMAISLFFHYRKSYVIARLVLLICLPLLFSYFVLAYGNAGIEYYYFCNAILAFYMLNKNWQYIIVITISASGFIFSKYALRHDILLFYISSPEYLSSFFYINIVAVFSFIFIISYLFKAQNSAYQQKLREAYLTVESRNRFINTLLKELNHRVKNNLQIISSLLNLQAHKIKDLNAQNALEDAKNRVVSMALIHQKLYRTNSPMELNLKGYINDLSAFIIDSIGDRKNTDLSTTVDDVKLNIEKAVTTGLIVNELVTNAIRHGFTNITHKQLHISVNKPSPERIKIEISNNGNSLPKNFNLEKLESFGLNLVKSLVDENNGTIAAQANKHTIFKVEMDISN
jgi:two-component sensor histidine kinase